MFVILCSGWSDSEYFLHDFAEETAELKLQQKVFISVCFHCRRSCKAIGLVKQPDPLIRVEMLSCFPLFLPTPDKPICHPHDQLVAESANRLLSEDGSDRLWLPHEMVMPLSWHMALNLQHKWVRWIWGVKEWIIHVCPSPEAWSLDDKISFFWCFIFPPLEVVLCCEIQIFMLF